MRLIIGVIPQPINDVHSMHAESGLTFTVRSRIAYTHACLDVHFARLISFRGKNSMIEFSSKILI